MPSIEEEVKLRGRHGGPFWSGDNKTIWLVIRHLTEGTTAWTIVKTMTNNGRNAYMALITTYLGVSIRKVHMKRANTRLDNCVFDGKSRN